MAKKEKPRVSLPKGRKPFVACVSDFWDRSPCTWFVDLRKLDQNDPDQRAYFELILDGLTDGFSAIAGLDRRLAKFKETDPRYPSTHWGGRPDSVKHARADLPCTVQGHVLLYYPE